MTKLNAGPIAYRLMQRAKRRERPGMRKAVRSEQLTVHIIGIGEIPQRRMNAFSPLRSIAAEKQPMIFRKALS